MKKKTHKIKKNKNTNLYYFVLCTFRVRRSFDAYLAICCKFHYNSIAAGKLKTQRQTQLSIDFPANISQLIKRKILGR